MYDFKIGDKVWCKNGASSYGITSYHRHCRVVGIGGNGRMNVVLEENYPTDNKHYTHSVLMYDFELIPENDSATERRTNKEVRKMEKPKTQLEKTACNQAKEDAIKKAVEEKKELYKNNMEDFVREEHSLMRLAKDLKERRKLQKELQEKLDITEEDLKELF